MVKMMVIAAAIPSHSHRLYSMVHTPADAPIQLHIGRGLTINGFEISFSRDPEKRISFSTR